jgi:hypothetical protein
VASVEQLLPTVRQQLLDPFRRMGADPIKPIAEVTAMGTRRWKQSNLRVPATPAS